MYECYVISGGRGSMVKFQALIKEIKIKSLVSLDKEARLILQFDANDSELLSELVKLQKADELKDVQIG